MHLGRRRGDEEAGHAPCLREAAQGTAFKIQGDGRKVLTKTKAGPSLVLPTLVRGRECPLSGGRGSFPPAWRASGLGLMLSSVPGLSNDAQDEQGDGP